MGKPSEKRRHKRISVRTNVYVEGEQIPRFKTQTMDFSDGGLFIEGAALSKLKIDTLLNIQAAEEFQTKPVVKARVAWTNRYGAGIEYISD
ncbi:PilZ domain-containing protein [Aliikangiella sp. IMCC44632]